MFLFYRERPHPRSTLTDTLFPHPTLFRSTLVPAALEPWALNPWTVALAFCLFRLFDVVKPWPVRWADRRLKGAFGVMADDVIAAAYAAAIQIGRAHV